MDIPSRKQALRRATVERLRALDPSRRAVEEATLSARFPSLPGFEAAGCVLLYASAFAEEIDTTPFLKQTLDLGKRIALPRVDRAEHRLRLFFVADLETDLRRGTLNIPEPKRSCPEADPSSIDWVLVPGLAFDPQCYRLGRGAGYYDRLLPTLRPDCPRWALALDAQWVDELPVEGHDVAIDGVVSASRTEPHTEP